MKRTLPFLAVLFFFYLLFYEIVQVIPMKELLRKGLMIQNIFVYSPLITVLVAAIYTGLYGFSHRFLLLVMLMFFCDHSDLWRMDFTISCDLFYMCISRYRFRLWSVSLEKGNSIKIK